MGVVSGNVRITIEMTGKGDAPAKVKETAGAVKSLGDTSQRASVSVLSLKDRVGALKGSISPVNALREGFENLRSNLGLVSLAAGALIGVVGVLVDVLDTPRVDATTARFFRLAGSVSSATSEIYGLVQAGAELTRSLKNIDAEIADLDAQAAEHLGKAEEAKRLREDAARGRVTGQTRDLEDQARKADEDANKAEDAVRKARQQKAANDQEINHLRALIDMRRQNGQSTKLQEEQLLAVEFAQGAVLVNLKGSEEAYRTNARAVDELNKKLQAYDRLQDALEQPKVEPPKKPPGGGGGVTAAELERRYRDAMNARPEMVGPGMGHLIGQDDINAGMVPDFLAGNDNRFNDALNFDTKDRRRRGEMQGRGGRAESIRDFSAALSDSIPGMSEFSGALRDIASSWDDVSAANDNASKVYDEYLKGRATEAEYLKAAKDARTAEARGAIASIGAIAMAGAEQIKNERLRAGVLSTIHLGLGTALMFVPGAQQEAFGHLAGAAILAGVAIFGGGGSSRSGSGRNAASRGVSRTSLSDRGVTGGGWSINIFGGWFGTSHPAETAAALHALSRRGAGSGFVPLPRAA